MYRRILSHLTDNLLSSTSSLHHNRVIPSADEDLSPTVERLAVLRWLELIDKRLPMLVARAFTTDLQTRTLKDIQPQIANAMGSLLDQLQSEDAQVSRIQSLEIEDVQVDRVSRPFRAPTATRSFSRAPSQRSKFNSRQTSSRPKLFCSFCQGWGRPSEGHDMATCRCISEADKQALARTVTKAYHVEAGAEPLPEDDPTEDFE